MSETVKPMTVEQLRTWHEHDGLTKSQFAGLVKALEQGERLLRCVNHANSCYLPVTDRYAVNAVNGVWRIVNGQSGSAPLFPTQEIYEKAEDAIEAAEVLEKLYEVDKPE